MIRRGKGASWSLSNCNPGACGTLSAASSASGAAITYAAPSQMSGASSIVLTATSVAVPAKSASAAVSIAAPAAPVTVTVSPQTQTLTVNQTQDFSATVQNDAQNKGVNWSLSGANCNKNACGTLSATTTASGTAITYTAPALVPNPAAISLVAISVADSSVSATAAITIAAPAPGVKVVVSPASQTVPVNHTQDFTATVQNDPQSKGVTWTLSGACCAGALCGIAKLFSCSVDAAVYPQTLWVANLPIAGGTHNVIFTATSHSTVYAFDADANPCVTYWSKNLIPSGETWPTALDMGSEDIQPDVGIVGTPVIDPVTKILYVVTKTKTAGTNARLAGTCHQRLHALSLIDGSETVNGPFELTSAITAPGSGDGSNGTRLPFDPFHENQRPGLALVNNTVYVSWGSHTDQKPWHGWIIGFNNQICAPRPSSSTPRPTVKARESGWPAAHRRLTATTTFM
jgi:hypothetical protein